MAGLLIGDVARRIGVSAPTIRYYESLGLLTAPRRSTAGYRRYTEAAVEELRFIKKAQGLGFSLDEVSEILKLTRSGQTPCSQVLSLGHQHLAAVEERIRQLQRFHELLAAELSKWEQQETAVSCGGLCQFITDAEERTITPDTETLQRDITQSARQTSRKARA
ncbi:MAG: heavy metal-responsive transcriptional regulator [Acidobacteria bacterium]|nr:heavy metal-responsive transcriptional regulator [Acidobacteriota bacterium]